MSTGESLCKEIEVLIRKISPAEIPLQKRCKSERVSNFVKKHWYEKGKEYKMYRRTHCLIIRVDRRSWKTKVLMEKTAVDIVQRKVIPTAMMMFSFLPFSIWERLNVKIFNPEKLALPRNCFYLLNDNKYHPLSDTVQARNFFYSSKCHEHQPFSITVDCNKTPETDYITLEFRISSNCNDAIMEVRLDLYLDWKSHHVLSPAFPIKNSDMSYSDSNNEAREFFMCNYLPPMYESEFAVRIHECLE